MLGHAAQAVAAPPFTRPSCYAPLFLGLSSWSRGSESWSRIQVQEGPVSGTYEVVKQEQTQPGSRLGAWGLPLATSERPGL